MVSPCILEHAVDQVELVLGHTLASQLLFELEYHVIVLVPYGEQDEESQLLHFADLLALYDLEHFAVVVSLGGIVLC